MSKREVPQYTPGEELAEEAMAKKLATLLVSGMSILQASKEMGLSRHRTLTLSNNYHCKAALIEIGDGAVAQAKHTLRKETASMVHYAIETLKHHLKNKNLNAIAPFMKIVGFTEHEEQKNDTSITVVMPNIQPMIPAEKTFDADYKEVEHEIQKPKG